MTKKKKSSLEKKRKIEKNVGGWGIVSLSCIYWVNVGEEFLLQSNMKFDMVTWKIEK